jgi:hypothetical protein
MLHNRCLNGEGRDGYITKIHAVGFNGIADITWAAVVRMMNAKSNAGAQCGGTLRRLSRTVLAENLNAGQGNDKRCFTGLTTHEKSKSWARKPKLIYRIHKLGIDH